RFLHVQERTVEQQTDAGHAPVPSLVTRDAVLVPWDEGVEERVDLRFRVAARGRHPTVQVIDIKGGHEVEPVLDESGAVIGRIVRDRMALSGGIGVSALPLSGPYGAVALRVVVDNRTVLTDDIVPRDVALRHS